MNILIVFFGELFGGVLFINYLILIGESSCCIPFMGALFLASYIARNLIGGPCPIC